ncbi:MAG TPA: hypothetical protein VGW78_01605 [Candidatus Babeliales bacterium]|jgi:hypothetical protein|nr:hypothetical protein [Candidatus Babeliales bacterium]
MAVYTKITKVYEELDKHVYTISNNGNIIDCIAVLIPSQQRIEIYRDMSFNECLYK